jgi:hypothetical protein
MHSPSEEHMNVVYQILQYLKNAPGKGLLFYKMMLPPLKAIQILIGHVIKQLEGLYLDIFCGRYLCHSEKQKVVARSSA